MSEIKDHVIIFDAPNEEEALPDLCDPLESQVTEEIPPTDNTLDDETYSKVKRDQEHNNFWHHMREMLTHYGFIVFIISFSAMILLYVVDVIILNNDGRNSNLLSPLFELLKFIISSLIGFLFANKFEEDK